VKRLFAILMSLNASCINLPSVYTAYNANWSAVNYTIDENLEVAETVVDCEKHVWMKDATIITCRAEQYREGWLIQIVPRSLIAGDSLYLLVPYSPTSEAKGLDLYASGIAFFRGSLGFETGDLVLTRNIRPGEGFRGAFSLRGKHNITGTFVGIAN